MKMASRGAPSGSTREGFTLIEVAVVLAIMTIAAAVVAPELWRARTTGPSAAVRAIQGAYASAREVAVRRGTIGVVQVDLATGGFTTLASSGPDLRWDTLEVGEIPIADVRLLSSTQRWAVARFDALGRGTGDPITVVGDGERRTIVPRRWTEGTHVTHVSAH